MRSLEQIIDSLPPQRRAKIMARGRELIAQEKALRHLREARKLTQQNMATLLGIDQAGISKIEKRSDMLISTLRSYVTAMGGSLRLTADFPDGVVEVMTLGEVAEAPSPLRVTKRRKPRLIQAD